MTLFPKDWKSICSSINKTPSFSNEYNKKLMEYTRQKRYYDAFLKITIGILVCFFICAIAPAFLKDRDNAIIAMTGAVICFIFIFLFGGLTYMFKTFVEKTGGDLKNPPPASQDNGDVKCS